MNETQHPAGETMNSPIDQTDTDTTDQQPPASGPNFGPTERHPEPGVAGDAPDDLMRAATDRIQALETSLEEMREKWMRAEAETQNVRTRAKRDVDDARQYAVQKFARDVVEAAENLRRGLASLPPADANDSPVVTKLREGFEGVERSFLGILERNGITGTDPTGAVFDANLHQAMAEQPSADHPAGTVIQAWTSAWTLNGRLLKPAMVVVAKAADPVAQPGTAQAPGAPPSQPGPQSGPQSGPAAAPETVGFDKTV